MSFLRIYGLMKMCYLVSLVLGDFPVDFVIDFLIWFHYGLRIYSAWYQFFDILLKFVLWLRIWAILVNGIWKEWIMMFLGRVSYKLVLLFYMLVLSCIIFADFMFGSSIAKNEYWSLTIVIDMSVSLPVLLEFTSCVLKPCTVHTHLGHMSS